MSRDLIDGWISAHPRWDAFSWRADILGARLAAWIANFPFFCPEPRSELRDRVLVSAARQENHLSRVAGAAARDWKRFAALKGLIYCGVCMPGHEDQLDRGLAMLEAELHEQILPDGGHCERSPAIHLRVLRHLVDIRDILILGQIEQPKSLQGAIDRMASMLRALSGMATADLRCSTIPCEEKTEVIDLALRQSGVTAKAARSAPHTGFQRLRAGKPRLSWTWARRRRSAPTGAPMPVS